MILRIVVYYYSIFILFQVPLLPSLLKRGAFGGKINVFFFTLWRWRGFTIRAFSISLILLIFYILAPITNRRQLFTVYFLAASFGKYARLAGILEIAFEGQVRAIEHSLQFTHLSCRICM
jgi:hypothetical protein